MNPGAWWETVAGWGPWQWLGLVVLLFLLWLGGRFGRFLLLRLPLPPAASLLLIGLAIGGAERGFGVFLLPLGDGLRLGDILALIGVLGLVPEAVRAVLAPARSLFPLVRQAGAFIGFERLRTGIDNVGVDVHLSPAFCGAGRGLVEGLLRQELARLGITGKASPPSRRDVERFRETYQEMLKGTTHRARQEGEALLVPLLQVAVVKRLMQEVHGAFDRQLDQLRRSLDRQDGRKGGRVVAYERLFRLARSRSEVEYRVRDALFAQLRQMERSNGAPLRKSLLGEAWPVPETILFNPLLFSDDPCNDRRLLLDHYALIGRRPGERRTVARLLRLLDRTLKGSVASGETAAGAAEATRFVHPPPPDCGGEFPVGRHGRWAAAPWWDEPENVRILFDPDHAGEAFAGAGRRRLRRHRRFQRRNLRRLERFAERRGLTRRALAAYRTVELMRELDPSVNAMAVYEFLCGGLGMFPALRYLQRGTQEEGGRAADLRPLWQAARVLRGAGRTQRRRALLRLLADLTAYRRDLENYGLMRNALDRVRLREESEELKLARANGCLYEFFTAAEGSSERARLGPHTVVKADVRGSTRITRELASQGLNPATHFERTLFAPLNELLHDYEAEKVFVEGDAVIAALLEYEDDRESRYSVARACGLASRLLELVRAHNQALGGHGLPPLQVGIGISHSATPPTYLFDEQRPVMISEAIERADRLSSSSQRLASLSGPEDGRLRVYALTEDHPLYGEKGQTDARYNVNGIELEPAGFEKLRQEIDLRRVDARGRDGAPRRFYAGRFPDALGRLQDLVVRVGRVRQLGVDGPGAATDRPYFEVISDPGLVRQVLERVKAAAGR